MKTLSFLSAVMGLAFIGNANAADITLYYSPTCPHCHHAQEFINTTLVYEYPNLAVTQINVADPANRQLFIDIVEKCDLPGGGVPVLAIGDKCIQGFGNGMKQQIRDAIEVDMTDADRAVAAENRKAMESDADAFRAKHAERANIIVEGGAAASEQKTQKKTNGGNLYLYILLIALVTGLGFVLTRKGKK